MEVSGKIHNPDTSTPGTHWIGGWVGPRAGLNAVVKIKIQNPSRESNPRLSSPYSSAMGLTKYHAVTCPLTKHRSTESYGGVEVQFLPFLTSTMDGT